MPPTNPSAAPVTPSSIAGSVLPIRRAEELLATLPGVISARIVANETGAVDEIHLLTTPEVSPKATVRNVESALIAHLGMRVDHRKISVATSTSVAHTPPGGLGKVEKGSDPAGEAGEGASRRRLYFEDVEVRRSRTLGVLCRVTLKKGDESFVGESDGLENERSRIELAARAAMSAILQAEGGERSLALDGTKVVDAFDCQFVFVGVTARQGRDSALLTGSCQIRDSAETASVLAVLDATNRWIELAK